MNACLHVLEFQGNWKQVFWNLAGFHLYENLFGFRTNLYELMPFFQEDFVFVIISCNPPSPLLLYWKPGGPQVEISCPYEE